MTKINRHMTPRPPRGTPAPERAIWDDLMTSYEIGDAYSQIVLREAVLTHQRARECREIIAAEGVMVPMKTGRPPKPRQKGQTSLLPDIDEESGEDRALKPHPLLKMEAQYHSLFLKALLRLRIDLAGTSRIVRPADSRKKRAPLETPDWMN